MEIETFISEVRDFLDSTGIRACRLAKVSGLTEATISRLVHGKVSTVKLSTINAIHMAINILRIEIDEADKESRISRMPNLQEDLSERR